MKKILFIIDNWGLGGRQITIKNLMENLHSGWKGDLLLLSKTIPRKVELPFPKGAKVSIIRMGSFLTFFFSLVEFFSKNDYDIISTHISPISNLFLWTLLAKKLSSPSTILIATNHGARRAPRREYPLLFLKRYVLRKEVDFIVAVSRELEEFMKRVWGIPGEKITTIYNPIIGKEIYDKAQQKPIEYDVFSSYPKLLAVARLDTSSKDFRTLLFAFSLLKKRYKEASLFVVGEGPDRDKINRWIEELNLKDSVFLLGARLNPYPYFRHADIFVLSSLSEGLGRVIVEAMALGCPVVATDCPVGPRELIGDDENGILVPMKDPTKMAEAMVKILEDKRLRERIVENGRRKAEEFTVEKSVQKHLEFFNKLLKEKRRINCGFG